MICVWRRGWDSFPKDLLPSTIYAGSEPPEPARTSKSLSIRYKTGTAQSSRPCLLNAATRTNLTRSRSDPPAWPCHTGLRVFHAAITGASRTGPRAAGRQGRRTGFSPVSGVRFRGNVSRSALVLDAQLVWGDVRQYTRRQSHPLRPWHDRTNPIDGHDP